MKNDLILNESLKCVLDTYKLAQQALKNMNIVFTSTKCPYRRLVIINANKSVRVCRNGVNPTGRILRNYPDCKIENCPLLSEETPKI